MYINTAVCLVSLVAAEALAASPLIIDFQKSGVRPSQKTKALLKSRDALEVPLGNYYGIQYNVNLTVGTPAQHLGVQLDTGSSNFWIPSTTASICANDGCSFGAYNANKSSTYHYVNDTFLIQYYDPSDFDAGDYITDDVGIAGILLKDVSIGVAYDGVDSVGVLGVSFQFEEQGMLEPTLIDLMKSQGLIDRKAYSMFLNDIETNTGSIIFGGIDTTKYTGQLISLPMQPDNSTNVTDLSVALTSVHMTDASGTHKVSFDNFTAVAGCLDSGTWDIEVPTDIANAIIVGMGAVYTDEDSYVVPCAYGDNANATFIFGFGGPGGPNISVPIREVLTDANFKFKDGREACTLGINPVDIGLGGIVLLGDAFLRSAYVVYDLENLQIALAQAKYGVQSSNVVNIPSGTGLPGVQSTATATVPPTPAAATNGQVLSTLMPAAPTYDLGTAANAPTATGKSGAAAMQRRDGVAMVGCLALASVLSILWLV
jgi:Eukaryotic aspartyl protease